MTAGRPLVSLTFTAELHLVQCTRSKDVEVARPGEGGAVGASLLEVDWACGSA